VPSCGARGCGREGPEGEWHRAAWCCDASREEPAELELLERYQLEELLGDLLPDGLHYCPWRAVEPDPRYQRWFRAYAFIKRGFLPGPGGWEDQEAQLMRAVEIIDEELKAAEVRQMEEAREEAEKERRRSSSGRPRGRSL
jgi:hypothetical protein